MALKRDCGTCAHNANGWACDDCKDHDKWMERDCCNCLRSEERSGDESCRSCWSDNTSFFPNFEPKCEEKKAKDEKEEIVVKRSCENCKYTDLSSLQEPCKYCFTVNDEGGIIHPTAWEAKDEATDDRPLTKEYVEDLEKRFAEKGIMPMTLAGKSCVSTATDGPALCTYQFQTLDGSCLSMAHAICKHYVDANGNDVERALIDLEELVEHIDAYVRAERKMLERAKTYLEKEG